MFNDNIIAINRYISLVVVTSSAQWKFMIRYKKRIIHSSPSLKAYYGVVNIVNL